MFVREILKEKGITTKELAARLEMTVSGLNQHLAGNPSLKVITAIAAALDVPLWRLFTTKEEVCADNDFFAVVKRGADVRTFDNAAALKGFCESL